MILVVSKKVKSPSVKDCDGCDSKISKESMAVALEATSKAKLPDGVTDQDPLPLPVDETTSKDVAPVTEVIQSRASLSKEEQTSKVESEVVHATVVEATTQEMSKDDSTEPKITSQEQPSEKVDGETGAPVLSDAPPIVSKDDEKVSSDNAKVAGNDSKTSAT